MALLMDKPCPFTLPESVKSPKDSASSKSLLNLKLSNFKEPSYEELAEFGFKIMAKSTSTFPNCDSINPVVLKLEVVPLNVPSNPT